MNDFAVSCLLVMPETCTIAAGRYYHAPAEHVKALQCTWLGSEHGSCSLLSRLHCGVDVSRCLRCREQDAGRFAERADADVSCEGGTWQ